DVPPANPRDRRPARARALRSRSADRGRRGAARPGEGPPSPADVNNLRRPHFSGAYRLADPPPAMPPPHGTARAGPASWGASARPAHLAAPLARHRGHVAQSTGLRPFTAHHAAPLARRRGRAGRSPAILGEGPGHDGLLALQGGLARPPDP